MIIPYSKTVFDNKIKKAKRGIGENDTGRVSKQSQEHKSKRNLTLTQIAEISGVPFGTVQRIMSGSTENPAFQAVVDVIKALGGSVDVYAGIASESEKPSQEDRVIDIYSRIVRDQNKKIIALFSLLAFLVVGAVLLIIYDIRHGNIGYIRYAAAEMRRTWLWLK